MKASWMDDPSRKALIESAIREFLEYNPSTGAIAWKKKSGRRRVGQQSTCANRSGYVVVRLKGVLLFAHRVAWFFAFNKWPAEYIDHINGIKADNRIENLREATNSENSRNRGKQRNNTSGIKGVYWHPQCGKWFASICLHQKQRNLGLFERKEEAAKAYADAAAEIHGEFCKVA